MEIREDLRKANRKKKAFLSRALQEIALSSVDAEL